MASKIEYENKESARQSGFPAKNSVTSNDLNEIKLKFNNLIDEFAGLNPANIMNADLIADGDRSQDMDSNSMAFINGKQFKFLNNVAPTPGEGSFEYQGYGSLSSHTINRIKNGSGQVIQSLDGLGRQTVGDGSNSVILLNNSQSGKQLELTSSSGSFNTFTFIIGASGGISEIVTSGAALQFSNLFKLAGSDIFFIYPNTGGNGIAMSGRDNLLSRDFHLNGDGRALFKSFNTAISDDDLINNQLAIYVDEDLDTVKIKVKKSNGIVFTKTIL